MSYDNPFVLATSEYRRDIDVLKHYVDDAAAYIQIMTGAPKERALEFVRTQIRPGGKFAFRDPAVLLLEREDNGDRVKKTTTLSKYIGEAVRERQLIAPTLTTYLSPSVKKSLLVDYVDDNVIGRNKAKKQMFAAEVAGDTFLYAFKKSEQTNRKLSNNAISGAHVSASTPLYNKTAHATLTSNCRSTSGYGNANNEKFLCGNRHYWSPEIVRNNIVSIVNHTDYPKLAQAMLEWQIRHPTVDETMECILYSSRLYWTSHQEEVQLRALVSRLSDIQRSAFVYTGDLYHLAKYNDRLVREFITQLATKITTPHPNPRAVLDSRVIPDDHLNLAKMLCPSEMRGKDMSDNPKFGVKGKPEEAIVVATALHIGKVLQDYRTLIRGLWVTPNVPASLAVFPESLRRAAITSDTDSTIFTVQDWVAWHQGRVCFTEQGDAVAAVMIFLAAQAIVHVLARMSANFGIEEKRLHQIAMKNEFKFSVFVATQVAKHYFAQITAQEGNIKAHPEMEIKGVHLKSSNAPRVVMKEAKKMMEYICEAVTQEKKISLHHMLKWVADVERQVESAIKSGSNEFFRMGQIKTPESYTKEPENSPYATYVMWQEVFAPKYGDVQNPPYMTVKISTELDTAQKTKEWIAQFADRELAARLEAWMERTGKRHMGTTFMLPEAIVSSRGIPEEILLAIDIRRMVLDTTSVFYIILETLGIYMLNDKMTRLCMDHH